MGIFRSTFKVIGKQFNVKQWVGYGQLKQNAQRLYRDGKVIFTKPQQLPAETFEEAKHRLQLSDQDLLERYKTCKMYFNFFIIFAFALLFYTLYLMYMHSYLGAILSLAITFLLGVQAFKYNFWMFQIKNKKLGCSFDEWRSGGFKNNNNHNKKKD